MNLKNIFRKALEISRAENDVVWMRKVVKRDSGGIVEDVDFFSDDFFEMFVEALGRKERFEKKVVEKEILKLIFLSLPASERPLEEALDPSLPALRSAIFSQIVENFFDLVFWNGKGGAIKDFGGGEAGQCICEAGRCFVRDVVRLKLVNPLTNEVLSRCEILENILNLGGRPSNLFYFEGPGVVEVLHEDVDVEVSVSAPVVTTVGAPPFTRVESCVNLAEGGKKTEGEKGSRR